MNGNIGILGYGSIHGDPGPEISSRQVRTIGPAGIVTPFAVEFARESRSRAGAPTLVPVEEGGAAVPGLVRVLDNQVDEQSARAMLWRRETRGTGNPPYDTRRTDLGRNQLHIARLDNFAGVAVVLYVKFRPTIDPLTPQRLAELALHSLRDRNCFWRGQDGVRYLVEAWCNGIRTPLTLPYIQEVERRITTALNHLEQIGLAPNPP